MNLYEQRQWQVKEYPFRREGIAHTETIFTIGNGLVGVRGSFEEGYPNDTPSTLVAGIFNHQEGELVPELVSMPNWLSFRVSVNGEECRLSEGRIIGYERILDMHSGTLKRGVLWLSPQRTVLRLLFERFASLAHPHILALRVQLQVLGEGEYTISVLSALDGTVHNPGGINHWGPQTFKAEGDHLSFYGETNQSAYRVAMQSQLFIEDKAVVWEDCSSERVAAHRGTFTVQGDEKITCIKLVTLHTSRDSARPQESCAVTLRDAANKGYLALKNEHDLAWKRYWEDFDVIIEGDEVAQRALRFCIYHILIATPTADERVSIGAKTLSGFGYKGHVFWDTELFMVPLLTLCRPDLSKRLLMYRYHNLHGARAKAAEAGYEGAMFPWESTDTGLETTPRWANEVNAQGERIRIWTGDNEQHISTDIAYAVLQYWRWTGDDHWFVRYGAEIVLDTARFWASRAEWNADKNRYELRMQIGPDEYHENVDNSVFTNRLVVWHLQQAIEVWHWLRQNAPEAAEKFTLSLAINDIVLAKWAEIAQKMWIPMSDVNGGVFEQFENFFQRLHPFNLADYSPRTANMDWLLGHEKTQRTRVIKQADVVMLMALLGEELGDKDFLRRNWETYYPIVDHGSSLSPSIHAWVAARLGLIETAYELFIYAATIDLEDHKGNVRDGIHAASCGGVWQAVVFGFCGLHLTPDGPQVRPHLPAHWRRVRFKVRYHNQPYSFDITSNLS